MLTALDYIVQPPEDPRGTFDLPGFKFPNLPEREPKYETLGEVVEQYKDWNNLRTFDKLKLLKDTFEFIMYPIGDVLDNPTVVYANP
jgi:hypothetical protein